MTRESALVTLICSLLLCSTLAVDQSSSLIARFLKSPRLNEEHHNPLGAETFTVQARAKGYPIEEHIITTEDGYLLTFHRIQTKNQGKIVSDKPVIFLQHGLFSASDTFIVNYEQKALAYFLANQGYDVWCGNSRGNFYGRNHTTLSPNDKEFWEFSWQEMAEKDVPAGFQYILNQTGKKINFVGHSQGGLLILVALAAKIPAVVDNVGAVISLGPSSSMRNNPNKLVTVLANSHIDKMLSMAGMYEFLPLHFMTTKFANYACKWFPSICQSSVSMMTDTEHGGKWDEVKKYPDFMLRYPAGTSLQNVQHFIQMTKNTDTTLLKFDYGFVRNLLEYGRLTPPAYKFGKITQKVHIFAGNTDKMATFENVKFLASEIKTSVFHEINGGHMTFLLPKDPSYLQDVANILKEEAQ